MMLYDLILFNKVLKYMNFYIFINNKTTSLR